MNISDNLKKLLVSESSEIFEAHLMKDFIKDASKRNPDVTSEKMLSQLARPKYIEEVKKINAELESFKIINRRK